MNNLLKLKIACDILIEMGEFDSSQCIAILHWKTIPEAAKHISTSVTKSARVSIYKLHSTTIAEIAGYGFFQLI